MQTLHQLIQAESKEFIQKVNAANSVAELLKMQKTATPEQYIIIDARIDNINHLVV